MDKLRTRMSSASLMCHKSGSTIKPPNSAREAVGPLDGAAGTESADKFSEACSAMSPSEVVINVPDVRDMSRFERPGVGALPVAGKGGDAASWRPTALHHAAKETTAGQRSLREPSEKVDTCSSTRKRSA